MLQHHERLAVAEPPRGGAAWPEQMLWPVLDTCRVSFFGRVHRKPFLHIACLQVLKPLRTNVSAVVRAWAMDLTDAVLSCVLSKSPSLVNEDSRPF